jgi:hypothetical protein
VGLRVRRLLVVIAFAATVLLIGGPAGATPSSAHAGSGTTVLAGSATVPLGGSGATTLEVHNLPPAGLAAWTIDVSYDPALVSIASCSAAAGGLCNPASAPGAFRVAGASGGGLFGNAVLATITFACGQQTGTSALTPVIGVLNDATPGVLLPINAVTQDGSVTCVVAAPTSPPAATFTPVSPPAATFTPQSAPPGANPTARPGAPTATRGPSGTATATSTRTSPSTPTATLKSSVLGSTRPPTPSAPGAQRPELRQAAPAAASVRPRTSSALPAPNQLNTNPQVIGSNFVLAIILLIVLFFVSALFNGTLDENRAEIERFVARCTAPFERAAKTVERARTSFGGFGRVEWAVGPVLLLGFTGLIYSFDEPNWGLNDKSLVLFLSVVIAVGVSTIVYEGGEAFVHRTRHQVPAGIRLFPAAIAIAAAFVALSRLAHFQAPVLFGFIAASAVFVPVALDRRQEGLAIAVPAAILLALSLVSWFLVSPLRHASNSSHTWWAVLPGETAAMLFASGIEGLLFSLIPLKFLDGWKVIRWNPIAWALLIGVPAFLFSWVILNPAAKSFDILLQGRVITALSIAAGYSTLAIALWAYFYVRRRRREAAHA